MDPEHADPNTSTGTDPQQPATSPAPEHAEHAADPPPVIDQSMLAKVRELVLAAHPDVVAELVGGDSFDAILASVEPARSAYARITEQVRQQAAPSEHAQQPAAALPTAPPAPPPSVPAGQPGRSGLPSGFEDLSPSAKIAEGLRRRGTQSPQLRAGSR